MLREHSTKRGLGQRVQTAIYRHLLPDKGRLNLLGDFIWFYQQTIGRWRLMNRLLPLREFVEIMPKIEGPIVRRRKESKESIHARQGNKKVMFFRGCIMDVMFSSINRQTTELLRHLGWSPIVPEEQTCCGALHAHAGDLEFSKELAKKNIMAFEASGARVIVHNAGGCGAMLYEYKHLFEGDSEWAERARKFSDSVQDISQIVASSEQGKFAKAVDAVVTYQCSCHLNHVEKVKSEPVQVIKNLPGVTYKQLPNGTSCCGSAGIYNLVHRKEADAILQAKMSDVKKVNAQVLVTSNPGCYLQMKLGIHQAGLSKQTRVVHLVELLAEASGTAD
ncbi:(Fe-S)-binding protein [Alicyclobacillus shizuokensis]|uniref:(Fe-S)-binding protein n=1 Tax=Alicyclobacillus shizuokensis TaxID=392014 RepID=UPI001FE1B784|nr:(Fe-S)-binding protein [Alicyclobacillus shizuokensis]